MALSEGSQNLPTDTGANKFMGATDGTNLYILRIDNSTAKNLVVTLRDAAGNAIVQDGTASNKKIGISLYGNTAARGDTPIQAAVAVGTNTEDDADNAAVTITLAAAGSGIHNYIGGIYCGYNITPANSCVVTVTDDAGTTNIVVFKMPVVTTAAGIFKFDPPMQLLANKICTIVLSASGTGGTKGYLNVMAWTDA